jgi:hypothetical protein
MGDNPGLVGPPFAPADLAGRLVRKVLLSPRHNSPTEGPILANPRGART